MLDYFEIFYIDDTAGQCPVSVPFVRTDGSDGPNPDYVLSLRHTKDSNGPHYIYFESGDTRLFRAEARCDNLEQAPVLEIPDAVARVTSISGAFYDVAISGYANDAEPREINLDDLVFIPV